MQPKPDWRQSSHWLPASKAGSWFFARVMPVYDKFVFRLSGGRHTAVSLIAGLPSLMLTVNGAKSGQPRTIALLGIPDEKRFIVIASNWGQKRHPAWYYNLRSNPDVTVKLDGKVLPYHARQVFNMEREECWNKAVNIYKGYNAYKQRAGRDIPVFVLEPK